MRPPAPTGHGRASPADSGPDATARRAVTSAREGGHQTPGERGKAPGQGLAFTNSSNIPGRRLRVMHPVENVSHYNYESFVTQ